MKQVNYILVAMLVCWLVPTAALAKRAPNLELKDLAGNTKRIADLRGSIVVVNFWATWCVPCRAELPMLSELTREYAGKKVRFIAVSADEARNQKKVDEFLTSSKVEMEVWVGADLDMLESAGLGNELPATMILDEKGEIVARVLGQAHVEDIRDPLEWLLGERQGPVPVAITKRY